VKRYLIIIVLLILINPIYGQEDLSQINRTVSKVEGVVIFENAPIQMAKVQLNGKTKYTNADGKFLFIDLDSGNYNLIINFYGYENQSKSFYLGQDDSVYFKIRMEKNAKVIETVVISGTLKEISKSNSPVPIEVYSQAFFKANPVVSLFESLQNVNGVRPQNNCNVCNTGDIHINGLEGPYTMVLIDGMPIVSGLAGVYGLSGIPQSLIERLEVVKGPASTLYGSEAVGGLLNVITKKSYYKPFVSLELQATSWTEKNVDLGIQRNFSKKVSLLTGINYFNYDRIIDKNKDGFTDLTLQHRISVFNKLSLERKSKKSFNIAGRYMYEDRWGGQTTWERKFRGGDSVYGESIFTKRWEIFGLYALPTKEDISLQFSLNKHHQNSVYGTTIFNANQIIGFGQLLWNKKINSKNHLLSGMAYRYTYYDDNTVVTAKIVGKETINTPSKISLPGVFSQWTHDFSTLKTLLTGIRYDYNSIHGSILTPRINYKWTSKSRRNTYRIGAGNGYRVANVFTEDHAALTGARTIEFKEKLKPEKSWNTNFNWVHKKFTKNNRFIGLDASTWFTYFTNRIIPDYQSNVNKIIYSNLDGYALSKGVSLNVELNFSTQFSGNLGGTLMDVAFVENRLKQRQLLTERFSGVWNIGYLFIKSNIKLDYTGNIYSPMLLPLLGPLDERSQQSPWYSIQNIQITKTFKRFEVFSGVKNLLNFTPASNSIARAKDPFDKNVTFDVNGHALSTANNPQALTFDPTYVYASNQGRRLFLGLRFKFEN